MLTIICAVAQNRGIGYHNNLLFHLSADLKRFKSLTTGHTIIMGRRTFPSLQAALNACLPDEDIYIIGGASVYAEAFPFAQRLCLTEVQAVPAEADVFFPEFDATQWQETCREHHDADERNTVPFDFVDYVRKGK